MAALLLDTHVLLWANEAPERLSGEAVDALEDPINDLFVSSISVAEIEIKRALGKLAMEAQLSHTRLAARRELARPDQRLMRWVSEPFRTCTRIRSTGS